jgi:subtilisin family serine protease
MVTLAPLAQGRGSFRVVSVPEASGRTANVSKALLQRERNAVARGESRMVSVIVRLSDESLASYQGKIPGLAATNPRSIGAKRLEPSSAASQQYLTYLGARQSTVRNLLRSAVPNARVVHQYQAVLNGMSLILPENKISTLAKIPGVKAVYEDQLLHLDTDNSPGFIGAHTIWNRLGGQESAGEGVIVGVLDTGVWPEHPSFSDPDPAGKAYAAPGGPARQCEFSGGANPGPAFACNNKLIGADRFMATYDALVGLTPSEYTSARDDNGHGTHTSSTAAGDADVSASIFGRAFGIVSGIAPRSYVMMYKVCGNSGCFGSDSVAAINRAILDGVNVINFSISGGNDPYSDAVSIAFLDAYNAGVFVAASAGNSGPTANTVSHREPWTTTVAASSQNRQFQNTLLLSADGGATLSLNGASITPALTTSAPVFVPPVDTLCQTPFTPGSVTGMVVVCQRGINARVEKGYNVVQGGAVGMILYNPSLQGLATDNHFLPSVHLEVNQGAALNAFIASHTNVMAAITAGTAAPDQGDVMAAFSSRGGPALALGIAKPDVTAPGVQILAGHTPTPATIEGGPAGQLFQAIEGTSMSSPHVAGSGALLKALHPGWTPGQIKSALMTTANKAVVKEDGFTPADPFDDGTGRINLSKADDPGLLIDETGANYVALMSHLWDANYPSLYVPGFLGKITVQRKLQSTRGVNRAWTTFVSAPSDVSVTVPPKVRILPFGSTVLNITVDGSGIPVGQVRHAFLELRHPAEATIRFPITVVRGTSKVPLSKSCSPLTLPLNSKTDCTITISNTTFNPANVVMTDKLPTQLKIVAGSVVNALNVGNRYVVFSGTVAGGDTPDVAVAPGSSPAGGYLPLSLFGIAPIAGIGDDTITNFNVPAFAYEGATYSRIGVASNGYLVMGGGSGPDNSINNQNFPDSARPNDVIAPFWTDLNPSAAGAVRIGTLTDGSDTWIVVDWDGVREFSTGGNLHSFQVWIGVAGDANPGEDVSIAYGPNTGAGDLGFASVGAENFLGAHGQSVYFNGAGSLPVNGTQLRVITTPGAPGETRVITYKAKAKANGNWTDCAEMTSDAYFGTQTACISGQVTN